MGASASVHYSAPTFGERMREAGYRTLMTGKWHAGQTPYQRGFDRYYGLTDGCCNFWNPGHSLVPTLKGDAQTRPWPIYWQFGKAAAMRDARYKLVRLGQDDWELYDLSKDPVELNDLAAAMPEKVSQMAAQWEAWWADKAK